MREWLPPGTMIARYQITSRLSANGVGEVYLARDLSANRDVALKILPQSLIADQQSRKKFLRIYALLSKFHDENVCEVYDAGITETMHPYVAMEYVKGQSLDMLGYGQQLTFSENIAVILQVADALEAAHCSGWLHLAIRPSNIMLTPQLKVKVLDFGQSLAFPTRVSQEAEETLRVRLGEVRYQSPEQVAEERPDQRSDIFSLGCVLYEMVAGHAPFVGTNVDEVIVGITLAEPLPLTEFREDLPPEFNRIVFKALAKNPSDRYQTVGEFTSELRALIAGGALWSSVTGAADEALAEAVFQPRPGRVAVGAAARTSSQDGPGFPSLIGALSKLFKGGLRNPAAGPMSMPGSVRGRREATLGDLVSYLYRYYGRRMLAGSLIFIGLFWAIWISSILWGRATDNENGSSVRITRLTTEGRVKTAVISPDATVLLYVIQDGDKEGLAARNLKDNSVTLISQPDSFVYDSLSISPDGKWLAYVKSEPNQELGLGCRRPVAGGQEEVLVRSSRLSALKYSWNSDRIAFIQHSPDRTETQLLIGGINGPYREVARHKSPSFLGRGVLCWSPNGMSLAVAIKEHDNTPYFRLTIVDIGTGRETAIAPNLWSLIDSVEWLKDGSGLVAAATEPTSRFSQIWKVEYPAGAVTRITYGQSNYRGVSLVANSTGIVSVNSRASANIWVAPASDLNKPAQITTDSYDGIDGLAWTPDNRLIFASVSETRDSIMITGQSLKDRALLDISPESGDSGVYQPAISPDGNYIAYVVERQGGAYLWRSEIARRTIKRISDESLVFFPSFSADGKSVIYSVLRDGRRQVARTGINGGIPLTLIEKQAWRPVISPDGGRIACNFWDDLTGIWKMAIFQSNGGEPLMVFDAPGGYNRIVRWMPGGDSLAYLVSNGGVSNIWAQPLDGTAPKQLTDFKKNRIFDFAWSPDGKSVAYAQGLVRSDAILIQNFRNSGEEGRYLSRRSK